ncbi:Uncharacterised protein [Zhongshania aliphaticivorans]|nr:Uncharacterised protein [Zhongshania aliphaticivorans]
MVLGNNSGTIGIISYFNQSIFSAERVSTHYSRMVSVIFLAQLWLLGLLDSPSGEDITLRAIALKSSSTMVN